MGPSLAESLRHVATGRVATAEPLAPFTSFRVGGPAAVLVEPVDEEDLVRVAGVLAEREPEVLVIGRGTNLLVSDLGFPGVVVRLGAGFEWISGPDEQDPATSVQAGGGAALPRVANYAARRALTGLEFAVAIPATVGGGVRMNAGAHGSSISAVLRWARVLGLRSGARQTLTPETLELAYRHSSIAATDVVCAAGFALVPGKRAEIARKMDEYRLHRNVTQPAEAPNAGSMFRNPEGTSAGYLIESAGLKGSMAGRVEVSSRHANFFLAHPGATAQQVHDLMVRVQRAVEEHSGVVLVPEIRVVGSFERADLLRRGP
jgi:UDP-N-acetylmuramate dehydrogenase